MRKGHMTYGLVDGCRDLLHGICTLGAEVQLVQLNQSLRLGLTAVKVREYSEFPYVLNMYD